MEQKHDILGPNDWAGKDWCDEIDHEIWKYNWPKELVPFLQIRKMTRWWNERIKHTNDATLPMRQSILEHLQSNRGGENVIIGPYQAIEVNRVVGGNTYTSLDVHRAALLALQVTRPITRLKLENLPSMAEQWVDHLRSIVSEREDKKPILTTRFYKTPGIPAPCTKLLEPIQPNNDPWNGQLDMYNPNPQHDELQAFLERTNAMSYARDQIKKLREQAKAYEPAILEALQREPMQAIENTYFLPAAIRIKKQSLSLKPEDMDWVRKASHTFLQQQFHGIKHAQRTEIIDIFIRRMTTPKKSKLQKPYLIMKKIDDPEDQPIEPIVYNDMFD